MLCLRLFCCATIVWLWKHKGGDVGNFISQIVLQCFARLDGEGKHVSIILTANIPEIALQATLPFAILNTSVRRKIRRTLVGAEK